MKIAIGCDHAGFDYKNYLIKNLSKAGHELLDQGTFSTESVDYPDFVHPVAKLVSDEEAGLGLLICGSGNGVCITANKHQKVRAALCWTVELAKLAKQHNNANVLCLPARFIGKVKARNMVEAFIAEPFEGGRHARRVDKITPC